jgi:predicted transposase YdaD
MMILLTRPSLEASHPSISVIIEMVTTIMVYKFEQLSRNEVEPMLGITLKETRVYREIKEEATFNLIIRQLTKQFGEISHEIRSPLSSIPLPVLENLSEVL